MQEKTTTTEIEEYISVLLTTPFMNTNTKQQRSELGQIHLSASYHTINYGHKQT